ncbi:hypothetical protein QYM36_014132 [Artemia franciscana]|uniref:Uncharacterized protein n=1 Tax=Artemia franciscana TaxID=6661 RepID=A0AA88HAJ0_ARTSF|nr:hypothetical protein QYM36_014132 [Artemia franciscana]
MGKATIEKKYDKAPRCYNLSLESGGIFRRNRRDIRPRYEFPSPTTYDGQQIGAADTIPPMGLSIRASTPDKQTSTKFVAEGDRSSAPLQVQAPTRPTPTTRVVLPNPLPTLTGDSSLYSQPGSSPVTITNQQVEQDTTATGGGTQPLASTSQTRTTTSGRVQPEEDDIEYLRDDEEDSSSDGPEGNCSNSDSNHVSVGSHEFINEFFREVQPEEDNIGYLGDDGNLGNFSNSDSLMEEFSREVCLFIFGKGPLKSETYEKS